MGVFVVAIIVGTSDQTRRQPSSNPPSRKLFPIRQAGAALLWLRSTPDRMIEEGNGNT